MKSSERDIDMITKELRRIRPRDLSQNFFQSLEQKLDDARTNAVDEGQTKTRRPIRILQMATGLAAMMLIGLTIWFSPTSRTPKVGTHEPRQVEVAPIASTATHTMSPNGDDSTAPPNIYDLLPTVSNYLRAMRESPEAFDLLMERHADQLMVTTPEITIDQLI